MNAAIWLGLGVLLGFALCHYWRRWMHRAK